MLCSTPRYPLGYYLGFEPPGGYALGYFGHALHLTLQMFAGEGVMILLSYPRI